MFDFTKIGGGGGGGGGGELLISMITGSILD